MPSSVLTIAVFVIIQLLNGLCSNLNTTFLVAVDKIQNDSVRAAVMRAIESISDTFPELLLQVQYTTDKQVCTIQLILDMIVYVVA